MLGSHCWESEIDSYSVEEPADKKPGRARKRERVCKSNTNEEKNQSNYNHAPNEKAMTELLATQSNCQLCLLVFSVVYTIEELWIRYFRQKLWYRIYSLRGTETILSNDAATITLWHAITVGAIPEEAETLTNQMSRLFWHWSFKTLIQLREKRKIKRKKAIENNIFCWLLGK